MVMIFIGSPIKIIRQIALVVSSFVKIRTNFACHKFDIPANQVLNIWTKDDFLRNKSE